MLGHLVEAPRPAASKRRAMGVLLLHAVVIWAACAAVMGIGMAVTSLERALAVHAVAAPLVASAVSAFYFRRHGYTSPFLTASIVLATIMLVDFFLVALIINRSLDMFRSVLGTWLPFALIFVATAATGWWVAPRPSPAAGSSRRWP